MLRCSKSLWLGWWWTSDQFTLGATVCKCLDSVRVVGRGLLSAASTARGHGLRLFYVQKVTPCKENTELPWSSLYLAEESGGSEELVSCTIAVVSSVAIGCSFALRCFQQRLG